MINGSWQTKLFGALTILTALVGAAMTYLKTNSLPDIGILITQITTGIGILVARQNNVTSEAANAK